MEQNTEVTVSKTQELIQREQQAQLQFDLSPIGQMVKQFEAQQRIAQMFSKSQIVPKQYQGNVADCAIAIDMAMRMNCNPLTVMQNLVVVQGRPTWQSQFLIACINQSGRFTTMQFEQGQDGMVGAVEYEDNEWDAANRRNKLVRKTFDGSAVPNYTCRAFATEIATGEVVSSVTIDVRMAVMERWYTKSGSKWQTMPRQMLIYRAAAFFQRAYCPEISMGFSTTDEIQDALVVDAPKADATAARRTLASMAEAAANTPDYAAMEQEVKEAEAAQEAEREEARETQEAERPRKSLL